MTTIDAAIVLVAHDRWFLEAVATATLELEGGRSTFFAGPWHAWREEKASRALAQARTAERQADELERLHRFVDRFRYGTKARQAQSKLKKIDRIERERVKAPAAGGTRLGFDFLQPERSGRTVVEAKQLSVAVPGRTLVAGASFAIERGERVALVGPNGSGKTTLLETILGNRRPAAGDVRLGHGVRPGYFSQHDVELDSRGSVLDCAAGMTGLQRNQAASLLGRFLFSGREAQDKPVAALSGGERRRLALAIVVASGANFLVLDEPTNHLDLESREALEAALEAFPGTVLVVSHDRALLDAVAKRTLALEAGAIRSYDGGWADYIRSRQAAAAPAPVRQERPKQQPAPAAAPRRGARELAKVEQEIAQREGAIAELERKLAVDWSDVDAIAAHRRQRDELSALLERWETLFEESQRAEASPS